MTRRSRTTVKSVPPSLSGLLQQLPDVRDGWTEDRRDEWLNAFGLCLELSVPLIDTSPFPGDSDCPIEVAL